MIAKEAIEKMNKIMALTAGGKLPRLTGENGEMRSMYWKFHFQYSCDRIAGHLIVAAIEQ
jgi:hypothetical protein